ncbi:hypothetical protein JTE90_015083 [Oedothorax gibbosus]|uniref:C2H2-type domain-containing protein n=1 Tax=Oedothorax gibbosus TaxID=931172 RepID=A0AAV6VRJ6_9ARAC|nr:hypothetical protein JTE90_015083 [Oedothorax gibbosus]
MASLQMNSENPTLMDSSSSLTESDFDSSSSDFDSTSSLFSSSLFSDSQSHSYDFSSEEDTVRSETEKVPSLPKTNFSTPVPHVKAITRTLTNSSENNNKKTKLALKITLNKTDSSKSVSRFLDGQNSVDCKSPINIDLLQLKDDATNSSCDICGEIFETQAILDVHKLSHLITETYTCEVCQYTCKNREDYMLHFKTHDRIGNISENTSSSKRNQTTFPCEICGKMFRLASSLKRHLENHTTAYTCNICNSTFPTELLCHQHKLKHAKHKSHVCQVCGKGFQRPHQLTIHMQVHSQDCKKFKCNECNTMYSYKTSLSRHMLKYHSSNTEKFKCDICGELFKTKKMLNGHAILHTAKKLIQCTDCNQTFKYRSSYHRHRVIHKSSKPFRCSNCGQVFKTESLLKIHKIQHVANDEFVCTMCDKSFAVQSFLDQHMLIHEESVYNVID